MPIGMAHEFPIGETVLTAERCRAYVRATGDENPIYDAAEIAPPMAVVLATVPLGGRVVLSDERVIGDPGRLSRLLHVEEDIRWQRPPRVGDRLQVRPFHVASEAAPSGEIIVISTEVRDEEGALVVETRSRVLVREHRPRGLLREIVHSRGDLTSDFSVSWTVAEDQSERYAEAADDRSAIHIDDAAARAAGFSERVLHGLCTMAFAQRAIVDAALDGDPRRLRRLRVCFTKPVYMGDCLTLDGACRDRVVAFEVRNQRGRLVIRDGLADVAGV
jgi:acyl dehydratase